MQTMGSIMEILELGEKLAIQTIISLSAGVRLPIYENAIFKDVDLAYQYVSSLCENMTWWDYIRSAHVQSFNDNKIRQVCAMINYYAFYELKGRWPEAETFIIRDRFAATFYGEDFECTEYFEKLLNQKELV
jgi:hypothetical protein